MRISDWSSDVCSSDLQRVPAPEALEGRIMLLKAGERVPAERLNGFFAENGYYRVETVGEPGEFAVRGGIVDVFPPGEEQPLRLDFFGDDLRSEEHTSELQSLMRISYAVFCLKKKNHNHTHRTNKQYRSQRLNDR